MLHHLEEDGVEALRDAVVEIEGDILATGVDLERPGAVADDEERVAPGIDEIALAGLDAQREERRRAGRWRCGAARKSAGEAGGSEHGKKPRMGHLSEAGATPPAGRALNAYCDGGASPPNSYARLYQRAASARSPVAPRTRRSCSTSGS